MDDRALLAGVAAIIGKEQTLDDCAVVRCGSRCLVLTTDMLHETTDFPTGMTDWQIGWMSAAVTISDIASMGATPCWLLLAAGLDRGERLAGIIAGAHACCDRFGCLLVGGDTDHHEELTVVTTGIGAVMPDRVVRRQGSKTGDLVCMTGVPGEAEAGLHGFKQHWYALIEPQPRVAEGQAIGRAGASAMMDVSDGLALSLYDLQAANPSVGYMIHARLLRRPAGVPSAEGLELALYGGGDFELLFTCAPDRYPIAGVDAAVIGAVIDRPGVLLDGEVLEKRGYQHQWHETG